VIGII